MKLLIATLIYAGASASRIQMEPDVTIFSHANWKMGERVSNSDDVYLQVFLKHDPSAIASFEKDLLARSSPKSSLYGQWLSPEEVTEAIAPNHENLDAVLSFLSDLNVEGKVNVHRDVVSFTAPGRIAEKIVGTPLYHYTHAYYKNVDIIRVAGPYSLPETIAPLVSLVAELIRFPNLRKIELRMPAFGDNSRVNESTSAWEQCGSSYDTYTNIAVLQERYGFPDVTDVASGAGMALAEFQGQYYDSDDLEAFSSQCGIDSVSVDLNYGGNKEARCQMGLEPCIESLLDIEYMGAVAQPIPLAVYYSSTYSLLDWATTVGDNADAEPVHSVSYGNDESQQTSTEYMYSCNTEFMKLGSKGISVLFASGDQGVWGRTGYSVRGTYNPDFPAGSPYITAVGGTDFLVSTTIGDETTWEDGGGGFSDTFAQPSWQADAVETFFETSTDLPDSSKYNATGRGYPDVAALAGTQNAYFISFKGGKFAAVGGTSAASPVVGGIFAMLVNERLLAGKTAMGWLNPFIYENGDCFNDVTSGTNSGGYSGGFTAIEGWDAATGYGTPNYDALLTAALAA